MLSSVNSFVVVGLTAKAVRVEADVTRGLPGFTVVGMRDRLVPQIRERVRAGLVTSGYEFPPGRVVVNVAPASLRRAGAGLDLVIAAAVLAASDQLDRRRLEKVAVVGSLSPDGRVLPVRGTQAICDAAWAAGVRTLVIPASGDRLTPPAKPVRILHAESLGDLAAVGADGSRDRPARNDGMARYAMALVVEGGDPGRVWEDVSATLGDSNNLLEDGHSCVFLGDPRQIETRDEYSTESVIPALLRRSEEDAEGWVDVSGLSTDEAARLTAALSRPDPKVAALAQIQSIASEEVYGGSPSDSLRWAKAKLGRISAIARDREPDEDWPEATGAYLVEWDGGFALRDTFGDAMALQRERHGEGFDVRVVPNTPADGEEPQSGEEFIAEREPDEDEVRDPSRREHDRVIPNGPRPRRIAAEIPTDVAALIAATLSREAGSVEAPPETWDAARAIFSESLAPEPSDEDGMTRIEADRSGRNPIEGTPGSGGAIRD